MKALSRIIIAAVIATSSVLSLPALSLNAPMEYTNMVVVLAKKPFVVDIFETTCAEANHILPGSCTWNSESWKPPRLSFNQADQICRLQGKRLPTMDEWLIAASGNGKNLKYTLIGDSIKDSNGVLIPNIKEKIGGSADPKNFDQLGIDAIGTVGMTGNRNEWVIDSAGASASCGGNYKTSSYRSVTLSKICVTHDKLKVTDGTARCVSDYDPNIAKAFTDDVSGKLEAYISDLLEALPKQLPKVDPNAVNKYVDPKNRKPDLPKYDKAF